MAFFYALAIGAGVLGIGAGIWFSLQRAAGKTGDAPADGGMCFCLGAGWFLGYFFCEGILNLMTVARVFNPAMVTGVGFLIIAAGAGSFYVSKNEWFKLAKADGAPTWDKGLLLLIAGFVFFWNLYPAFDVDSLSFYFYGIKQFLEQGGRVFSLYADIRLSVPFGENYLFAPGFALWPGETVFPQIIHGLSKVMFVFGVYGAARMAGTGRFALIAAALVMSEEHLVASGANLYVRINMVLTASVFFAFFSLFFFSRTKRPEYLALSLVAAFGALSCKYICAAYFLAVAAAAAALIVTDAEARNAGALLFKRNVFLLILLAAGGFSCITYVYNWIATGTPLFPAAVGPFDSKYYDPVAADLARDWLFHFGAGDAVKYLSIFSVWPGILASKLLFPLILAAGTVLMLFPKGDNRPAFCGLAFAGMSAFLIMVVEVYMVFEMRYYRYGIGIYALAATFFLAYLFEKFFEYVPALRRITVPAGYAVILAVSLYCAKYSFDVMGENRPSAKEVTGFLGGEITTGAVIERYYRKYHNAYQDFRKMAIDPAQLGFIVTLNWPHAFYPLKGANLAFVKSSGLPAASYYNEGLFAEELRKKGIKYVFNQLASNSRYPVGPGAAYNVFTRCGNTVKAGGYNVVTLDEACLDGLIAQKNPADAQKRLADAVAEAKSYPPYNPFNPPPYGGASGVIR